MLFNVENGTLELDRTSFGFRDHRREDLLTKLAPVKYDEKAQCPRWTRFLEEVFQDHTDIIPFIQRAVGYSLTGRIREHCLFQMHGTGRNGKGTFIRTIGALLGDYAIEMPFATFLEGSRQRSGDAANPQLARLQGTRFVAAQELKEGSRLNEEVVKWITGKDRISARTLYEKPIEFNPTHKLWFSGNHKPVIVGTDVGIWSRIKIIPFDQCFKGKEDYGLDEDLKRELPGILNWAIAGILLHKLDIVKIVLIYY